MFLDSVISKMYHRVIDFLKIKFMRTSSNVSFLIPISSENTINTCNHHITSYIKFSTIIKKRIININLDYVCFVITICMFFFIRNNFFYFRNFFTDPNTSAPVRCFPGFNYPYIWFALFINNIFLLLFIKFIKILKFFIF